MARKKRTDDELRAASDHLWYEIWMLNSCTQLLASGINDRVIKNALIESFAIHARQLLHFLYPDRYKVKEDDLVAYDFFPTEDEWKNNRIDIWKNLPSDLTKRVGKEIAHITYFRQSVTDKTWQINEINAEFISACKRFYELVTRNLLGSRWQRMPWNTKSV
ncbi:MAG: hypothetical protein JRJ29_02045 [Deltaproteobacteria bacterium]|nr:hypothetical protein [Deltaproteobacteria bacterium]